MPYDYSNADLRAAAVEAVISECGHPPARECKEYAEKLNKWASLLEIPGGSPELLRWIRGHKGEALTYSTEEKIMDAVSEADAIAELLEGEDETLSAAEMLRLHMALDKPVVYKADRNAIKAVLKSSMAASRADMLRRLIQFLGGGINEIRWVRRNSTVTVPDDSEVEQVPLPYTIPQSRPSRSLACMLVIRRNGNPVWARLFAKPMGQIKDGRLHFKHMAPLPVPCTKTLARRIAVAASIVSEAKDSEGKRLAGELKITEAAVHYIRKDIGTRINEATGGKAGIRGMRWAGQANRGVSKGNAKS